MTGRSTAAGRFSAAVVLVVVALAAQVLAVPPARSAQADPGGSAPAPAGPAATTSAADPLSEAGTLIAEIIWPGNDELWGRVYSTNPTGEAGTDTITVQYFGKGCGFFGLNVGGYFTPGSAGHPLVAATATTWSPTTGGYTIATPGLGQMSWQSGDASNPGGPVPLPGLQNGVYAVTFSVPAKLPSPRVTLAASGPSGSLACKIQDFGATRLAAQDARFTINPVVDARPGERWFHANDKSGLHEWRFGDGATSDSFQPIHAYAKPGSYAVEHCRPANGTLARSCSTQTVVIGAPALGVSLTLLDEGGEPYEDDTAPRVGDTIGVRMRVSSANPGVGALSNLAPVDAWIDAVGAVTPGEEPDLPEPFSLEPGEHRDLVFPYTVDQAGLLIFRTAIQGEDAAGVLVQADGEVRETVGGIGVEVEVEYPEPPGGATHPPEFQADNDGDGEVDDLDHIIEVKVTATNLLDETIHDVHLRDADEAVDFVNRYVDEGAAGLQTLPEDYEEDFGDLEVGKSVARRYRYLVTKGTFADAYVRVQGNVDDGATVTGFGAGLAHMEAHLALEVKIDLEERPYKSGDTVRLFGTLENLLQDRKLSDGSTKKAAPLAVIVTPITDGNAGGGFVSNSGPGGATPIDSDPVVVQPGSKVEISAILATQRAKVDSRATVRYLVRVWEQDVDHPEALATEIDASRVVITEDGELSAEHSTDLAANPPTPDEARECETTILDGAVTCNLWVGLRSLAYGIKDLAFLVKDGLGVAATAFGRETLWEIWLLANTFKALNGDEAAKQALLTELEVQVNTFVEAGVMGADAAQGVADAFTEFVQQTAAVVDRGDAVEIAGYASRFLGENPDLGIAAFTKLRAMRAILLAGIADEAAVSASVKIVREANLRAAAEAQEGLVAKVQEAAAQNKNPAEAGIFQGDEDVTDIPEIYEGVAGARAVDVKNALKIAKAENILIAFRSRSPISAKLIDTLQAWLKPMDIKAKTVNVIDHLYLGFRESSYGKVELTEPPIDWRLTAPGHEAELAAAADAHMEKLSARFTEIAEDPLWYDEVRARLIQRAEEFPKELANFERYKTDGIKIEFGYGEQGLPRSLDAGWVDTRAAQVVEGVTKDAFGIERTYYQLKMRGPAGGAFRFVTGDIDIVAILNLDRTLIFDPVKRKRIYDALRELLGMQHGDTITYTNAKAQARLLRDHVPLPDGSTVGVDTLFVAAADERLRTGFLQERFSTYIDALDDVQEGRSTFHLVSGAPAELISQGGGTRAVIDSYQTTWDRLQQATTLLVPGKIGTVVPGLTGPQVDKDFDRSADAVRATGNGQGLERYEPGSGPGDRSAAGRLPGPVGATDAVDDSIAAVTDQARAAGIDLGLPAVPGPGALGGTWKAITVADALAPGDPDLLELAPITSMPEGSEAGARSIVVTPRSHLSMNATSPWFEPGDTVVVDPGGPTEERATVSVGNALTFAAPLANAHAPGTNVILLTEPAEPTPTTTTTPTSVPATTPAVSTTTPSTPGATTTAADVPADPSGAAAPDDDRRVGAGSRSRLARTGFGGLTPVAFGLSLITAGVAAVWLSRRRRI